MQLMSRVRGFIAKAVSLNWTRGGMSENLNYIYVH